MAKMDVKDMTRKRNTITSRIQAVIKKVDANATAPLSLNDIDTYLHETLPKYTQDAEDLHNRIMDECIDDSLVDAHIGQLTSHEDLIHNAVIKLKELKANLQPKVDHNANKFIELKLKRKTIFTAVEEMLKLVDNHVNVPITMEFAECYLIDLNDMKRKVEPVHDEILNLSTAARLPTEEVNGQQMFRMITETQAKVKVIIKQLQPPSAHSSPSSHANAQSHVKLPTIQLPTFDGRYENWNAFKDMFNATVDSNASLSGAQKLQYLIASLKGEAATIIKGMQITDDNYVHAWVAINERYNNTREILEALLNRLQDQAPATKESASELRKVLDTTTECRSSLQVIGQPMPDQIFVHQIVRKLDPDTRRRWRMSLSGNEIPDFKKISEFLNQAIRGLQPESSKTYAHSTKPQGFNNNSSASKKISSHYASTGSAACALCNGDHPLHKCDKFLAMAPSKRSNVVKQANLCYNCLKPGHGGHQCRNPHKCRKCNGPHHTLLHRDQAQPQERPESKQEASTVTCGAVMSSYSAGGVQEQEVQVLLATAIVDILDKQGCKQECRVLLDGGSETSLVSERCMDRLGLKRKRANVVIKGIGSSSTTAVRGQVNMKLHSRVYNNSIDIEALILPKVTGNMPSIKCPTRDWSHVRGLKLADQAFHTPGPIDVLLGADYVATVFTNGKLTGEEENTPTAFNTIFGWVLMGRVATGPPKEIRVHYCQVEQILQKFWNLEEMPNVKHLTKEEKECEQHFAETHQRKADGRYVVQLPTKPCIANLGESRQMALKRLNQVNRRLARDPDRKSQYSKFMQEFVELGHMQEVDSREIVSGPVYYLPHHCVIKESSTTTKLRVVFDGSAKSTTGLSVNDCCKVGPTVQDDLYTILLRFRTHVVALKADIAKMYRQFEVADQHQNLQRILWNAGGDGPLKEYKIIRVTYGTASAPYLATRCLQQLSKDEEANYPVAASIVGKDFYVDDLMSGTSSAQSAILLQQQLTAVIEAGAMELTKWASNSEEVMSSIPINNRESLEALAFDPDQRSGTIKALGVCWSPRSDTFSFRGFIVQQQRKLTKRIMLSELSRVFDPLGLLSPFTVRAKILFQELWKEKLDWDEELPEKFRQQWIKYTEDLQLISKIEIPRCLVPASTEDVELHGFCDGAEPAYGATVYYKSTQPDGTVEVRLITSKSRVSPVKVISIPRLELCAAVMLANLITTVKEAIGFHGPVFLWSDSETVLKWLAADPSRWKVFIANRVAEIHGLTNTEDWRYVNTLENPADLLTRGKSATELQESKLWWSGPDWLQGTNYPMHQMSCIAVAPEERRVKVVQAAMKKVVLNWWEQYSSYTLILRVTAWWQRFIKYKVSKANCPTGPITPEELHQALLTTIKQIQQQEFGDEIQRLNNMKPIKEKSKLYNLAPFLDNNGMLRVGGRLQHSSLAEEVKHPLLLPSGQHQFTKLLIRFHHLKNHHAGQRLLQATIQRNFWILRARDAIRMVIGRCTTCRRQNGTTAKQFMGSLPAARVNPGIAFDQTGVDFAGAFLLRDRGRGKVTFKYYVCVLVCMATKAVHLEDVSSLSTGDFIAALRRFTARRGKVSHLYSDCGTNFVGADAELRKFVESMQFHNTVQHRMADEGVTWHFNVPGAPHQGGLWEAAVKSMKFHLRRVMKDQKLTVEEFRTLLCEIEGCLNSRPLCNLSSDPADILPLTPGHFLIGRPINALPDPDLSHIQVNRLSRWQLVQQMTQHFWRRWSEEYLNTLQQRYKWAEQHRNLKIGDVVLIRDENQPPTRWAMGRITAVHPGTDNYVRCATVKTSTSEFRRPVTKLCLLLDFDNDEDPSAQQQNTRNNS